MNDAERLEAIDRALEDLSIMSEDHMILVEGMNDEKALRALGIHGLFGHIQSEGGPIKIAERVFESGMKAVVLTDWDRKGGILSAELGDQLSALGVRYDTNVRKRLSVLCSSYIKDVESLDSFIGRLNE
jgi:5S rRNA maturation endonuclease (ribonuclease M5)